MTELICSAKSGSDWTTNELAAYNITVEYQNAATFSTCNLPQPATINPAVFTATDPDGTADDSDGSHSCPSRGICCQRFAVLLLHVLGYNTRGRVLRMRKDIPLIICGENRHAKQMCASSTKTKSCFSSRKTNDTWTIQIHNHSSSQKPLQPSLNKKNM